MRGWWLGILVACGSTEPLDNFDPDAGVRVTEDAGARTVEVGTGRDFFQSLDEAGQVDIILGPQGGGRVEGYHIWGGARFVGFASQGALVRMRYYLDSDGALLADQERRQNLQPSQGTFVTYGFAPRLSDCCLAEGQMVRMRVDITDMNGNTGSDERAVMTRGVCEDGPGGPSLCP